MRLIFSCFWLAIFFFTTLLPFSLRAAESGDDDDEEISLFHAAMDCEGALKALDRRLPFALPRKEDLDEVLGHLARTRELLKNSSVARRTARAAEALEASRVKTADGASSPTVDLQTKVADGIPNGAVATQRSEIAAPQLRLSRTFTLPFRELEMPAMSDPLTLFYEALNRHRWYRPSFRFDLNFNSDSQDVSLKFYSEGVLKLLVQERAGLEANLRIDFLEATRRGGWEILVDPVGQRWVIPKDEYSNDSPRTILRPSQGPDITLLNTEFLGESVRRDYSGPPLTNWEALAYPIYRARPETRILQSHTSLTGNTAVVASLPSAGPANAQIQSYAAWLLNWNEGSARYGAERIFLPVASFMPGQATSRLGLSGRVLYTQVKATDEPVWWRLDSAATNASGLGYTGATARLPEPKTASGKPLIASDITVSPDLQAVVRISNNSPFRSASKVEFFRIALRGAEVPSVTATRPAQQSLQVEATLIASLETNGPFLGRQPVISPNRNLFVTLPAEYEHAGGQALSEKRIMTLYEASEATGEIAAIQMIELPANQGQPDNVLAAKFSTNGSALVVVMSSGRTHIYDLVI